MALIASLTRRGAWITRSRTDLDGARTCFTRDRALYLPGLLEPDLLAFVQQQVERDGFTPRVHDMLPNRPVDLALNPSVAAAGLLLAANNQPFLEFARSITGRDEIKSFFGTVHRRLPGGNHRCEWHSDLFDGRVAALTINLSAAAYEGGVLQIRQEPDGPIIYQEAVTGPGDGILFALGESLKHRVTDPEGTAPRTVFAGWFRTEPVAELFRLSQASGSP